MSHNTHTPKKDKKFSKIHAINNNNGQKAKDNTGSADYDKPLSGEFKNSSIE